MAGEHMGLVTRRNFEEYEGKGDVLPRVIAFKLFVVLLCIYLLTVSGSHFLTDVSRSRLETAKSIVERGDLSVPEGAGIRGADGRDYALFGIGSTLLALPFYLAAKLMGVPPENAISIINPLLGAMTAVLIFFFCLSLGYTRLASLSVSIIYGLGTAAWFVAKDQGDHAMEIFFVLSSVYCIYRYITHNERSYLPLSAVSLGIAFMTRYTSLLVVLPIFVMVFLRRKSNDTETALRRTAGDAALFAVVVLPFVFFVLWYNYYRFGSILETGYSLLALRSGIDFFEGTPLIRGISGFLISPGKGFFYYSPVALLFFFSVRSFIVRHFELAVCFILVMASYLLVLSTNLYWHGDCTWGPRYLYVITPLLLIPIAELVNSPLRRKKRILRTSICFLFVLSFIIQFASVSVSPDKYFISLKDEQKVNFTVVAGRGAPLLIEPPPEVYFDWQLSPLLAQFRYLYEAAANLPGYKYEELKEYTPLIEKIKASPPMNVFDFWWLYKYYVEGSRYGFLVALALLSFAVYAAAGLYLTLCPDCNIIEAQ
jgi:4-amino-4-deoxy-L-arabinose transferase-like glycosyltransferase